jgi:hypothetical protein
LTPLCELALKYGTDKYPWYTPFYDSLLRDRRDSVRRVLEIGIGTIEAMSHVPDYKPGASLRMWRDYFPNAEIQGIDVDERVLFSEDRITTGLSVAIEDNTSPFDLIVDDASHLERHQIHSVNSFIPFVQPDGFYIIEDVNDPKALSPYLPAPHFSVSCIAPDSRLVGQCIVIPR